MSCVLQSEPAMILMLRMNYSKYKSSQFTVVLDLSSVEVSGKNPIVFKGF